MEWTIKPSLELLRARVCVCVCVRVYIQSHMLFSVTVLGGLSLNKYFLIKMVKSIYLKIKNILGGMPMV